MGDNFANDDDILDDEGMAEDISETAAPAKASRAWRSIERYREMKELRKHLDDFLLEDFSEVNFKDLNL